MTKLLKTGIFGIACAVSVVNATQEKDVLKADYEAIKAAILGYETEKTKAFDQDVEKQIEELDEAIYWASRNAITTPSFCEGRGDYNDNWNEYVKAIDEKHAKARERKKELKEMRRALCEANNRPYDLKAMRTPTNIDDYNTDLTFGQLKSMAKDNKYLSSIDAAISKYFPEIKADDAKIRVTSESFKSRLRNAKKMDDGWIVSNVGHLITDKNIGARVYSLRIDLFDPSKVSSEIEIYQEKVHSASRRRAAARRVQETPKINEEVKESSKK